MNALADIIAAIFILATVGGVLYVLGRWGIVALWEGFKAFSKWACQVMLHGLPRAAESRPDPLTGADYAVRRVIERGESDEDLIRVAENVAYREYNAAVPRELQQGRSQEWSGVNIASKTPWGPMTEWTISPGRMTDWTVAAGRFPPALPQVDMGCPDCEFETVRVTGSSTSWPVRTVTCPAHGGQ